MAIRIEYQVDKSQVEAAEKALKDLGTQTKKTEDAQEDLSKESKTLTSDMGDLANSFTIGGKSVGDLTGAMGKMPSVLGKVTGGFKTLKAAMITSGVGILVVALGALFAAFTRTTEGAGFVSSAMASISAVIDVVLGRLGILGKAVMAVFQGNFAEAASLAKESVTGIGDAIVETAKKAVELDKIARGNRNLNRTSLVYIATLEKTRSKLEQLRDDATLSFKAREDAAKELLKVETIIADEQIKVATRTYDEITKEILRKRDAGIDVLADEKDAQAEALIELKGFEAEKVAVTSASNREINQLSQDRLEKDLDILIDGFDRQKMLNEQQIASDALTYEQKQALILETQMLADKSFEQQVKIAEELAGKQLDINELVKESDAIVLLEKIRAAELSEIAEGRVLEIINERKTVLADLAIQTTETEAEELGKRLENEKIAFEDRKELIDQQLAYDAVVANQRKSLEQGVADAQMQLRQAVTNNVIQSLKRMVGGSKEAAIAFIAIDKAMAIGSVFIDLAKEKAAIAVNAAANPANAVTFGAAGAAQYAALSGIATGRAGINVGTILAQGVGEVMALADGVIDLQGGVRGKDSIPSLLMPGESVMTTAETRDFYPTLTAIRKGDIAPELLNGISKGGRPAVHNNVIEVPRDHITIDETGFTLRQIKRSTAITRKQNRYKMK